MRKVVELDERVHQALLDVAHTQRIKMKDLGTVLVAYGLENLERAVAEADRLLTEIEAVELKKPELRIIRR